MPTITPFLWFDTDLAESIAFYTSIFPSATVDETQAEVDDLWEKLTADQTLREWVERLGS